MKMYRKRGKDNMSKYLDIKIEYNESTTVIISVLLLCSQVHNPNGKTKQGL